MPQADAPETPLTAQERMAAKVRTPAGQALYARRKVIVEPVFGQSKAARGFRRFWLRGLATIRGEWRLVCLTHNRRKIWRYGRVLSAAYAVWRPVYGRARALGRTLWRRGAAMALRRQEDVQALGLSRCPIDMPNQGSKSRKC